MEKRATPTDTENIFEADEIIVSKTDLKGHITYVNDVFCKVAEMAEAEALGKPHNIIRHPDMPRAIFYLLWQQIKAKKEIFAYVKNMATSGNYYWVYAHVTPTIGSDGEIIGYHSSRRAVDKDKITKISKLYETILTIENKYSNPKEGIEAGIAYVKNLLHDKGMLYDDFVWSI